MKKIIVYCHGYGSSSKTDKVERLRAVENSEVVAFDINIDPEISISYLTDVVTDYMLTARMHEEVELVFVGTSLGAWYANILGEVFRAKSVLLNPCYDPSTMLKKYGVSQEILDKYSPMIPHEMSVIVIAQDDEVIDYSNFYFSGDAVFVPTGDHRVIPCDAIFVPTGGHRFNGPEFEEVIVDYLNTI